MSIITYKNLQVESSPSGEGGIALTNNFKTIADNMLKINDNSSLQIDSGGNSRGTNSIDLQQTRSNGNQVASGTYGFIAGGANNRITGNYGHAEGFGTLSAGDYCHAEGYNTIAGTQSPYVHGNYSHAEGYGTQTTGTASHAEGYQTSATNDYTHAEGYQTNAYGGHAEGSGTTAYGAFTHSEGIGTFAGSDYSHTEGIRCQTIGYGGNHAEGIDAKSENYGEHTASSGKFSNLGDAQYSRIVFFGTTINNTQTEIFPGNNSNYRVIIPTDTTWGFVGWIVARRTDSDNESAFYEVKGAIDNNNNTVALVGAITNTVVNRDSVAWVVDVQADNSNKSIAVKVTGENAKNIRWVATLNLVQVTG